MKDGISTGRAEVNPEAAISGKSASGSSRTPTVLRRSHERPVGPLTPVNRVRRLIVAPPGSQRTRGGVGGLYEWRRKAAGVAAGGEIRRESSPNQI